MFKNVGESWTLKEDIPYSDLYKEIVSKNKNKIKPTRTDNTFISINKINYIEFQNDVK